MLTPDQKQINADTWRHIWNVQRFIIEAQKLLLKRSLVTKFYRNISLQCEKPDCVEFILQCALGLESFETVTITSDTIKLGVSSHFNLGDDADLVECLTLNTLNYMRRWLDDTNSGVSRSNIAGYLINRSSSVLLDRCLTHDQTKLCDPEVSIFCEYTPRLAETVFGSPEYAQALKEMKPALDNHYKYNRHHPEHYPEGIKGMTWLDIIEMSADWAASSMRMKEGSFKFSVEKCKTRFKFNNFFSTILLNTYNSCYSDVYSKSEEDYLKQGM